MRKPKIAFIKFGGLSSGGTERWLQMMAANMARRGFDVTYFYCNAAPYIGSSFIHPSTDESRKHYLISNGVRLEEFQVGYKDITKPTHDWINTNFWEVFSEDDIDIVQCGKAGPAEYPFHLIKKPVVEFVAINGGVDDSTNIAYSIHPSQWQRSCWLQLGGKRDKSAVIPVPVVPPMCSEDLRNEIGIAPNTIVLGFHQRDDNNIFSEIPLMAFKELENRGIGNIHFILKGGGDLYKVQAERLNIQNITFFPHDADSLSISRFLNTIDIFAHGRKDGETFGAVLAEAMIHKKPCISHFSLGGANAQRETMGPGGIFCRSFDEYTSALQELIENDVKRDQLSLRGYSHAQKYYSEEICSRKLSDIYCELLNISTNAPDLYCAPIDYGDTRLGFLCAGDIDSPPSLPYYLVLEKSQPEEFYLLIVDFFLPTVSTFVDIGANVGLYSLYVASKKKGAKVYAFEPQDSCFAYLETSSFLNNFDDRVKIFRCALGERRSTGTLYLTGTGSSFDHAFNGYAKLPTSVVEMRTFDEVAETAQIERVDFIKIDVEGFELSVLKGSESVLKKFSPILLVEIAESIPERGYKNEKFISTFDYLRGLGYTPMLCEDFKYIDLFGIKMKRFLYGGGLRVLSGKSIEKSAGIGMYLFLPNSIGMGEIRAFKRFLRRYKNEELLKSVKVKISNIVNKIRTYNVFVSYFK